MIGTAAGFVIHFSKAAAEFTRNVSCHRSSRALTTGVGLTEAILFAQLRRNRLRPWDPT